MGKATELSAHTWQRFLLAWQRLKITSTPADA